MTSARTVRNRLVASVATVLAATLGAGLLAVAPAGAAGGIEIEPDAAVVAAGSTGFLVSMNRYRGDEQFWIRYDTGARTPIDEATYFHVRENSVVGDHVLLSTSSEATVRDMGTGATVLRAPLERGERPAGLAGGAMFLQSWSPTNTLRMYDAEHGSRLVTGVPDDYRFVSVRQGTATHALLQYRDSDDVEHRGTIDLATGTVAEDYAAPLAPEWEFEAALSDTRIAWKEYDPASKKWSVVVHTRGTSEKQVFEAGTHPHVAFLGDRLVHADWDATQALSPSPLNALNIVDLKTGATTRLLDHVRAVAAAPDGTLLVTGGKIGTGDGVFRVSADGDSAPTARFLVDSGRPAELAEVSDPELPSGTIDFDKQYHVPFTQYFNHKGVKYRFTIRHGRTGRTFTYVENGYVGAGDDGRYPDGIPMGWGWGGSISGPGGYMDAFNGAYTWESVAESGAGLGTTPIKRSGSFTITRTQKPHDFDDNGSPDVLARDASGILRTHDSGAVGGGWQIYDRIEATGDIAGTGFADIVARDRTGVLWLYQGNGRNGFLGRVKVGGGWQTYEHLTGGSDFTGDGRPDLVAADKTGALYLYRATGDVNAPFATRKKIGTGWGIYNQLTATGNIAGAAPGDLLARDKDGVLWMYLGKGDGTFTGRTRIGGGFGRYSELIGAGDYDRDKKNDLLAVDPATKTTYVFRGTGQRYTPFNLTRSNTLLFKGGSYNLFS
ncbi:VCBS repeat-containing protein [Streptomyces sp. R302]|uniref:FG-GAP repeat domain-containing protein n=1 Tax=unclassified Streptomyces TaxID=2593676 RepID=UPI00145F81E8|nr:MULTISPECIES: VCBS repeat-containing protein [unclassified Streptomyces]NML50211.1 VCBS repeat-containing protein [Streptomyces sp. R301]NML79202.1 VCBS repeat-containing protein [Streptomyces sp. R302]